MNQKAFGSKIRDIRRQREMTGEMLAGQCGISPAFLRQIESGTKGISVDNLIRLCNALNVAPGYLLSEDIAAFCGRRDTREDFKEYIQNMDSDSFRLFLKIVKTMAV